jgi:dTDP-4-amino-4,6-dideoxygalactose transaminase
MTGAVIDETTEAVPLFDLSAMSAEVDEAIQKGWKAIMRSRRFIGGPYVDRFEQDWAAYCGTTDAIGVANGTDALEITMRALDIGPGDEVILPANTFTATAEAVVMTGARPRFVDVDPESLLLSPETITPAINGRTAAILVVHLYGHMPDMEAILDLASARGLAIIEDAAQAHGSTWRGKKAGSFGRAGCFSFYPGKNLGAYGDGGAIVTNDTELATKIRSTSNHGRSLNSKYSHDSAGRNSRLDAVQAVVLSTKLPRLDAWNTSRRSAIAAYSEELQGWARCMVESTGESISAYHQNVVRVQDRARVQRELLRREIETDIHYPTPLHMMRFYGHRTGPLPVAELAANEVLSLPLFPNITSEQIARVCLHLRDVLEDV